MNQLLKEAAVKQEASDMRTIARRALVHEHGPKTSAWLVAKNRKALHRDGVVDFVVPEKPNEMLANKLRWFFVAMDFLRYREGWSVDIFIGPSKGKRTFRVKWLSRGYWSGPGVS